MMRIYHWLLLATAIIFLGSIVTAQQAASAQPAAKAAAAQTPKPAAPPAAKPATPPATKAGGEEQKPAAARSTGPSTQKPVVHVNDVMHSMIEPASTVVFDAVATTIDATGIHEKMPTTDEEWETVRKAAVVLTEAPNLLMIPGRTREMGGRIPAGKWTDWNRKARELIEAGQVALAAANEKSSAKLLDAGERIDVACDECHEPYQIVEIPGETPAKPAGETPKQ